MSSSKREEEVKENVYETLSNEVSEMLNENGKYTIKQFKEKDTFTFILCTKDNADRINNDNKNSSPLIISRVIITIREDKVNEGHQTRSSEQVDATIFYIKEVFTNSQHRGIGWATLLLIYGMCTVKKQHDNINIFTLEDCSNLNQYMISNLYAKLGFGFQGLISLDKTKSTKIILDGPEKQLDLNTSIEQEQFKIRAMKRLKDIIIRIDEAGKKTKKTQKKQKKHKKNTKKTQKKQKKHKKTK